MDDGGVQSQEKQVTTNIVPILVTVKQTKEKRYKYYITLVIVHILRMVLNLLLVSCLYCCLFGWLIVAFVPKKSTATKITNMKAAPALRLILDSEKREIVIGKRMNKKGAIFHEI